MNNTYIKSFLFFSLIALLSFQAHSQCNIVANAGPDQVICAPGLVTLTGSGTGSFSNISWTPLDGVNDPSSLSTSVTVSQTTTYTLTLSGGGATNNIIVDGSFTGGGVFESDYIPGTGGPWGLLSNEGEYAVGPNPQAFHTAFQPCGDHTSGGGNMMVVNGSTTPNENVWCQTVAVQPNTLYEFSTWVTSVLASNPAELQFSINGVLLGSSFNAPGTPCQWNEFFETWSSGSATSAEICIVNQNTVAGGNDFALDDIAFGPVCNDTDEVTVTVVDVVAATEPTAILPCEFGQGITISGNGSSTGPGYTYNWTTPNGNIVSGGNTLNPIVNSTGFYELTVTLTAGTTMCTETASVEVVNDPDVPYAEAAQPTPLSCTDPLSLLDGNGSTVGGNIEYQWTTTNGSFSGPTNELIANAASPGSYTLTVTNILNGCTDDVNVLVTSNFNFPVANPVPSGNLSCANPVVTINGSGSTPAGLVFAWSTAGGNITSPTDQPSITVNAPGSYLLTVSNPANGCTDTEQVSVTANTTPPNAVIATPSSISCTTTSLSLNATGSNGTGVLSFNWSTSGGNIVSGVDSANPIVNAIGTYTVTVTQSSNGCTATASVQVTGDNSIPTINIAPPSQLTCATNQTTLSATATGNNLTNNWTTNGGTIVNGGTTLTPLVNGIGTYTLTVSQPNGCTAVSSVQVTNNVTPPAAEAGPAPSLNCQSTTAQLNGNGSATGSGISYQWTTSNGQLGGGTTTLNPTINSAGTYFITVLNAANGCSAMDSVVVLQNNNFPTVAILPPAMLNCNTENTVLNASNSSSGSGFTFAWTTTGGNFAAGQNTLSPTVDAAGTYLLTITNTASQCTSTASVTVAANFNAPVAAAAPPVQLNCDIISQLLNASASTFGNNSQFNWTATQGGNILAGATTLNPQINNPGVYTLIINDLDSQCADTLAVTVTEDVTLPVASTGPAGVLTCTTTSLNLNGNGSSQGAGFTYLWTTTNGNIVSGENSLTPLINLPGNYLLTVENTSNGCSNVATVAVTQNGNFPVVNAGTSAPLTCVLTETNLNATADQSSQFIYFWTTSDGEIVEDETTLTPLIGASGTYVLTVTNSQNGCTSTSSVTVGENIVAPTADAGSPGVLSCTQNSLTLSGSGAAPNGSVAFSWTTANGNIQNGPNTTTPTINAPGTYVLTVTNNANGCTADASVVIAQDASLPIANAGTADDLTCVVTSVQLDASGSSQGAGLAYQWTTTNGQIQGSNTTLTPTVTAPGTYLLTVTNTASNCTTISSVNVLLDNQLPTVNPGPTAQLTCTTTQLQLNGNGSSTGPDFSYQWTTTNGSAIAGATTLNPTITEPGLYSLQITNNENGCEATNSVNITENTTPPAAAAAAGGLLTCANLTLNLSGNGSSSGAGFTYLWTTTNGNILNGATTLSPTVNEPGLYLLTVTNTLTGCTNTAQLTALENTTPPMANAGPTSILTCASPSVSLSGTGSQGAGFGYQWTAGNGGNIVSGGNSLTPTVNAGGTYLLTVTNSANGCTSTSQVAIQVNQTEPTVSILPPAMLTCTEQAAELNGNGSSTGGQFSYAWTTTNGNFTGPLDALQTNVDAPGIYVLTITNTTNGCESSSQVTVGEDVDIPQMDAGNSLQLNCNETTGNLAGNTGLPAGQWSAVWTTSDGNLLAGTTGLTPTVGAPGTYVLTITNSLTGCSNTDEVTVTEVVFADFEFEVTPPSCLVETGVIEFMDEFGGTPPFLYSIDGGTTFSTQMAVGNLSPGTYELVVQDDNGCELTDIANLPEPPVVLVTLGADTLINLGDGYQLDVQTSLPDADIATIEWKADPSLSCLDCRSPLATPRQQTDYFVKITSKEGCTAEDHLTVFVKKEVDIYVPNAFSPNGDGVNDVFMIFAGGNSIQEINSFLVFDRWGETVYQFYDFQPNNPTYSWDGKWRGLEMNPAVFVWFAEVELIDGSKRLLKGDVSLIR